MKRGFLFGLGSFLILFIIGSLLTMHVVEVVVALILMPVSVFTIRAAKRAPPNRGRWHAIGGWFIGFFAPDAVALAVGLAIWALAGVQWGSSSTLNAQWWNPFAPSDYEECAEKAARDAKSKAALDILLNACDTKFPGRRKLGGGYIYYDFRQNRSFDIAGPNPTQREVEYLDQQYSIYQEQEQRAAAAAAAAAQAAAQQRLLDAEMERKRQQAVAEQEMRRQQAVAEQEKRRQQAAVELDQRRQIALRYMQVTSSNVECYWPDFY